MNILCKRMSMIMLAASLCYSSIGASGTFKSTTNNNILLDSNKRIKPLNRKSSFGKVLKSGGIVTFLAISVAVLFKNKEKLIEILGLNEYDLMGKLVEIKESGIEFLSESKNKFFDFFKKSEDVNYDRSKISNIELKNKLNDFLKIKRNISLVDYNFEAFHGILSEYCISLKMNNNNGETDLVNVLEENSNQNNPLNIAILGPNGSFKDNFNKTIKEKINNIKINLFEINNEWEDENKFYLIRNMVSSCDVIFLVNDGDPSSINFKNYLDNCKIEDLPYLEKKLFIFVDNSYKSYK